MKSRIGRTPLLTRRLRAAQIPTGIPMATAMRVATTTSARVCIASTHRPIARISRNASRVNSPNPHLRSSSASATRTRMTMYGLGAVRTISTASSRTSITVEMAWNNGPKLAVNQSTNAPTGAPTLISGIVVVLPRANDCAVVRAGCGERGEQGRAGNDADQTPVGIGDAQGHTVAAHERTDVGQWRVRVDGPVLVGHELAQRGALLPDGGGQQIHAGDAGDPALVVEHVGAHALDVAQPAEHVFGVVVLRGGDQRRLHDRAGGEDAGAVDVGDELGDVVVGRGVQNLLCRSELHDLAVAHDHDSVAHAHGLV